MESVWCIAEFPLSFSFPCTVEQHCRKESVFEFSWHDDEAFEVYCMLQVKFPWIFFYPQLFQFCFLNESSEHLQTYLSKKLRGILTKRRTMSPSLVWLLVTFSHQRSGRNSKITVKQRGNAETSTLDVFFICKVLLMLASHKTLAASCLLSQVEVHTVKCKCPKRDRCSFTRACLGWHVYLWLWFFFNEKDDCFSKKLGMNH